MKNVEGFIKVGDFLKDTFKGTIKSVKDSLKDKDNKGNKKKWFRLSKLEKVAIDSSMIFKVMSLFM